ncbi:MAG TPA: CoB--CoM heterodisulfide reductase iron-sulfur subunit B family protein [Methanobacterium sp.]|nr:MAG: heterodisulfide reductase subunit B [Methanobacterium sp.]HOI71479.1 CoB--CoM heterodisulfide reductase iron-sulfur subunit B family protein [Methanobacterium sp.]
MKKIPDKDILIFKSCLISGEYPGVESSTKYLFDKLGVEYVVEDRQSCCTGLGYYYDLFDQYSTTALAARNFAIAREIGHKNIATMCSTCYAILKKSCNILNENDKVRNKINQIFKDSKLDNLIYSPGDMDSEGNIFHVAEVLWSKKAEIKDLPMIDLSELKIATHHACHYFKVHYKEDSIGNKRNPLLLDDLANACGTETIGWYDHKKTTCGAGFRQRYANLDLSLSVTADKLMSLKENDVDILLHMCPNCQMQFDRYQPVIEKNLNTKFNLAHLNIAQFLALAMGADPYKVVGIQTHTVSPDKVLEKIKQASPVAV